MSWTSGHSIEAAEGEVNGGSQQTSAAQSMTRHTQSCRHDYGSLHLTADGVQTNALSPVVIVIDRGVRTIINFARKVPGFNALIAVDQICLIKR